MLVLVEQVLPHGKAGGFGLTRFWANLEWSFKDNPRPWDRVEYGTWLNYILPKYNDVVVYTYDPTKFSVCRV